MACEPGNADAGLPARGAGPPAPPSSAGTPAFLAATGLLAVALRFFRIGHESLWFDEGWTAWVTGEPRMPRMIRADVVAPLYFYLVQAWRSLAGDVGEAGLRLPSALFAAISIVPFWIVCRATLASPSARVVAVGFFAVSTMQIDFAQEARPYALLGLCSLAALACVPTLADRPSWPARLTFAGAAAAGMYTHNMMAFTGVGLVGAWLAWPGGRPTRSRLADVAVVCAIGAALYAPWMPTLIEQTRFVREGFWASPPGRWDVGVALARVSGVDVYAVPAAGWAMGGRLVVSAGVAMGLTLSSLAATVTIGLAGPGRRRLFALALFAFVPIASVFVYSRVAQPLFMERIFIATSGVTPILLAGALDGRRRRHVLLLPIGLMALASTCVSLSREQKEDWRGAYAEVARLPPSSRRLIVFVAAEGELPFKFYADRDGGRVAEPRTGLPGGFFDLDPPRTVRRVRTEADVRSFVRDLAGGRWDEVVLVLSHDDFADPSGRTEAALHAWGRSAARRDLRLIRLMRFVRRAEPRMNADEHR